MPKPSFLHFHTHTKSIFSWLLSRLGIFGSSEMAQAQERPRITEIQVRIDCNGCVQKIKKALQGINGISDVYIDLPQQKLTIIGWANPDKIIKAIKKARKNATIYSCSEMQEPPPAQKTDSTPPENEAPPPPDNGNPPAEQSQTPQPVPPKDQPPSEPPKDPPPPTPAENQTNEPMPPPPTPDSAANPNKDVVEEVHVIHHHPPDSSYRPGFGPGYDCGPPGYSHGPPNNSHGYSSNYGPEHPHYSQSYRPGYNPGPPQDFSPEPRYSQRYGPSYNLRPPSYSEGYGSSYSSGNSGYSQRYEPGYNPRPSHSRSHGYGGDWRDSPEPSYRPERPQGPEPIQVTHSYSQYRPPSYVTQYEYVRSPPRQMPYARTENYYYSNGDYQNDYNNRDYQNSYSNNGYVPSMFSEENPNACTIS